MIASLSPLFAGPLEALGNKLLQADEAPDHTVPAADVFTAAGLDRVIARHGKQYAHGDARAVLSQWSKYYLSAAVVVPVAANLILGRELPLGLDRLGLVLSPTGEVEQLVLPHDGSAVAAAAASSRFLPLIHEVLAPAIGIMAAHASLSPRVFWSNAGHYFDHLAQTLAPTPGLPDAVNEASRLMHLRYLADGHRNPLFRPTHDVVDAAGARHRLRRVCCIRYRLERLDYCSTCPLPVARCRKAPARRVPKTGATPT